MKKKEEKKLRLGKVTVQDFPFTLDRDEQKQARGGSLETQPGTVVPIFCKP
ncbi:MAG: hypothetical protein JSV88_10100 [Candidatus Aminicenantes bacterium]|nr:MAG: hypothetical protein JSV88_10100 [Candidatus Aminicenantes bacterium]